MTRVGQDDRSASCQLLVICMLLTPGITLTVYFISPRSVKKKAETSRKYEDRAFNVAVYKMNEDRTREFY